MTDDAVLVELPKICAVMVHDLRNPIAAISTNLQFLRDSVGTEGEPGEALADSVMLCDVLDRLLKNFDLLARKPRDPRALACPVRPLVSEIAARLGAQAAAAGVTIELGDVPASLVALADRDLLSRAIENVLANAIDHSPRGAKVTCKLEARGKDVVLTTLDARRVLPVDAAESGASGADTKRLQARFGRGLTLLCASIAASVMGGRVETAGAVGAFEIRLALPSSEERA